MPNTTPTGKNNDVLHEMIRSIKEEILPEMRQEIKDAFARIEEKIKKHDEDIEDLREYVNQQKGSVTFAKWLLSIISLSSLLQWVKLLSK